MSDLDRSRMLLAARDLRQVAEAMRGLAPAVSVRADGLATEIELRIKKMEAAR